VFGLIDALFGSFDRFFPCPGRRDLRLDPGFLSIPAFFSADSRSIEERMMGVSDGRSRSGSGTVKMARDREPLWYAQED
jgi:hypothetical protein